MSLLRKLFSLLRADKEINDIKQRLEILEEPAPAADGQPVEEPIPLHPEDEEEKQPGSRMQLVLFGVGGVALGIALYIATKRMDREKATALYPTFKQCCQYGEEFFQKKMAEPQNGAKVVPIRPKADGKLEDAEPTAEDDKGPEDPPPAAP